MEEKLNTVQSLIGVLNSPIAQRKGVIISPEHCKIWVEELTKFLEHTGWHPASEPPVIPEGEQWTVPMGVIFNDGTIGKSSFGTYETDEEPSWDEYHVKWWCYLPQNN